MAEETECPCRPEKQTALKDLLGGFEIAEGSQGPCSPSPAPFVLPEPSRGGRGSWEETSATFVHRKGVPSPCRGLLKSHRCSDSSGDRWKPDAEFDHPPRPGVHYQNVSLTHDWREGRDSKRRHCNGCFGDRLGRRGSGGALT